MSTMSGAHCPTPACLPPHPRRAHAWRKPLKNGVAKTVGFLAGQHLTQFQAAACTFLKLVWEARILHSGTEARRACAEAPADARARPPRCARGGRSAWRARQPAPGGTSSGSPRSAISSAPHGEQAPAAPRSTARGRQGRRQDAHARRVVGLGLLRAREPIAGGGAQHERQRCEARAAPRHGGARGGTGGWATTGLRFDAGGAWRHHGAELHLRVACWCSG